MLGLLASECFNRCWILVGNNTGSATGPKYSPVSVVEQQSLCGRALSALRCSPAGMATNPQTVLVVQQNGNAAIHLLKGFDEQPFLPRIVAEKSKTMKSLPADCAPRA